MSSASWCEAQTISAVKVKEKSSCHLSFIPQLIKADICFGAFMTVYEHEHLKTVWLISNWTQTNSNPEICTRIMFTLQISHGIYHSASLKKYMFLNGAWSHDRTSKDAEEITASVNQFNFGIANIFKIASLT